MRGIKKRKTNQCVQRSRKQDGTLGLEARVLVVRKVVVKGKLHRKAGARP